MALDNADIQLISRVVYQRLYQPNTALAVCRDRSSEVVGGGDNLRVDNYLTTYSISDVNYTADLTYQDLNDGSWILELDKRRAFAMRVQDSILKEKPYDAMVAIATEATQDMRKDLDAYIVSKHAAATFTAGDNRFTINVLTDSSTTAGSATKDKFDTANTRASIVNQMVTGVYKHGLKHYWPENSMKYALVMPEIKVALVQWMIETQRFGIGDLNNQALLDGAFERALGYRIIVNHSVAGDFTKSGTAQAPIYCGIVGETCHFAQQFTNFERMRDPNRFADLVRSMMRYGAGVQDNNKIARIDFAVSTT